MIDFCMWSYVLIFLKIEFDYIWILINFNILIISIDFI